VGRPFPAVLGRLTTPGTTTPSAHHNATSAPQCHPHEATVTPAAARWMSGGHVTLALKGGVMTESIDQWWQRRQRSKGTAMPYAIGQFRDDWARYPVLVRQYHPDLNHGITLTQIPPAADVYLLWQCDVGHSFTATPEEQRQRPTGSRRRSTWCPECAAIAVPARAPIGSYAGAPASPRARTTSASVNSTSPSVSTDDGEQRPEAVEPYVCGHPRSADLVDPNSRFERCPLCLRLDGTRMSREHLLAMVAPSARVQLSHETSPARRYRWVCPVGHGQFEASLTKVLEGRRCPVCVHARAAADAVAVGESFVSPWAPKPASAAEADLRQRLRSAFAVDFEDNAVRVSRPFFSHIEVWPDFVIPEFRVALEYDTTGRDGLEHVGRREEIDQRKDRLLRAVGWEVIRIRCGKLQPIGPYDLLASGVSGALVDRIVDRLAEVRGDLIVRSYLSA
jgi:very-short-patch-repair endonuclease